MLQLKTRGDDCKVARKVISRALLRNILMLYVLMQLTSGCRRNFRKIPRDTCLCDTPKKFLQELHYLDINWTFTPRTQSNHKVNPNVILILIQYVIFMYFSQSIWKQQEYDNTSKILGKVKLFIMMFETIHTVLELVSQLWLQKKNAPNNEHIFYLYLCSQIYNVKSTNIIIAEQDDCFTGFDGFTLMVGGAIARYLSPLW